MSAGLTVEMESVKLNNALRDWKNTHLLRILIEPATGKEIDGPHIGRRFEGVECDDACRAVLTVRWLKGYSLGDDR